MSQSDSRVEPCLLRVARVVFNAVVAHIAHGMDLMSFCGCTHVAVCDEGLLLFDLGIRRSYLCTK